MKNNISLSIIIPTYNSSLTLQKCLESIVSQTFVDFEILIIDGVSTDNTLEIAKNFFDTRIKILSEPDKGIYDAMNKGIKLAKGEWLYFLGSDDTIYKENVLENVFSQININEIDVVYGNVVNVETHEVYDGEFTLQKIKNRNICHQSIFFRKRLFLNFGYYNLNYKVFADYDFNIKWFFSSRFKHLYIDLVISNYATNGFSSLYTDERFFDDKPLILLKYGLNKLNIRELKELSSQSSVIKFKNKKYLKYVLFRVIFYMFRIIDFVHRLIH